MRAVEFVFAVGWVAVSPYWLLGRLRPEAQVRHQARARSRAARSVGPPCVASTCSTGRSSSGRNPSVTCLGVTPSGNHSRGISRPWPKSTSVSPAMTARAALDPEDDLVRLLSGERLDSDGQPIASREQVPLDRVAG